MSVARSSSSSSWPCRRSTKGKGNNAERYNRWRLCLLVSARETRAQGDGISGFGRERVPSHFAFRQMAFEGFFLVSDSAECQMVAVVGFNLDLGKLKEQLSFGEDWE